MFFIIFFTNVLGETDFFSPYTLLKPFFHSLYGKLYILKSQAKKALKFLHILNTIYICLD